MFKGEIPQHTVPSEVLPSVRKHLLREGGVVVPAGGCLEAEPTSYSYNL